MDPNLRYWGLLRRRECLRPTWRGWLAGLAVCVALGFAFVRGVEPFLAMDDPVPGGALVVEGWVSDYVLEAALAEFRRQPYEKLYVTGGPLERGEPLSEYKTFAELGAATLVKMGLETNKLQAVPAPRVYQDRTYVCGVALRQWFRDHNIPATRVHVFTAGAHARRSRLMFQKAFGNGPRVGVTAVPIPNDSGLPWWRTSLGVRTVMGEVPAYLYARFLFWPSTQ